MAGTTSVAEGVRLYNAQGAYVDQGRRKVLPELQAYRTLVWALEHHRNTRNQKMRFQELDYLFELYKIMDKTHHAVVEKSVQCFPGDTRVATDCGYRKIKDIRVGDKVLTHEGVYRRVQQVFCRGYTGEVVERRADLLPRIVSTPEHPFLCYPYHNGRYHYSKFNSVFANHPVWSHGLKKGDFVLRSRTPETTGKMTFVDVEKIVDRPVVERSAGWFREKWGRSWTRSRVRLDWGFGLLVGLYLSDGWINETRLCFGFSEHENDLEQIVKRELDKFQRETSIHIYSESSDHCRRVFICSKALCDLFSIFGKGAEYKRLPDEWMRDSPSDFLAGVFQGCLMGDGHVSGKSQTSYRTVSESLAYQVLYIGAMFEFYGVVREERPCSKRKVFSVVFSDPKNRKWSRMVWVSKWVASRLRLEKMYQYTGMVYNLEVEIDHSYVVEGYIVHNCGLSELFIIQSHIEAAEDGMTIMYVLPKYELRNRFVNNRIYKLHKRVPHYAMQVYAAEAKVHRTSLMHFGRGTLAYVGSNVSDEFIEIPVDSAFVDEKDRCNQSNLLMLPDRLTASPYKYEREISNPTVEGFGIDLRYMESSRGVWMLKCPHCGKHFTPDFFKHVIEEVSTNVVRPRDKRADPDPESAEEVRLTHECGGAVDRLMEGEWVHELPKREWQGFRVSKTFSKFATLRGLYRKYVRAVGNELKTQLFWNSDLGLPFTSKGAKITRAMLNECRERYEWPVRQVEQGRLRTMGVDVGDTLHVVMRERVRGIRGLTQARLILAESLPGFSPLEKLIRDWKPTCVVVDAQPEIHKLMELKDTFKGIVWGSRFQEGATDLTKIKDKRELRMDRTALMDYVRQGYESRLLLLPLQAEFIDNGHFYDHMMAPTRVLDANEDNPEKSRYVWREGNKPDHYFLAEAYCMQAGMVMPDHGIFDFFMEQAGMAKESEKLRIIPEPGMSDGKRQEVAVLQGQTPETFLARVRVVNQTPKPVKPKVDDQRIKDTIEIMIKQGYVDVHLAAKASNEHEEDVKRVLLMLGYSESRIKGQYIK